MKYLSFVLFALVLSTASASADWDGAGHEDSLNPEFARYCVVSFKKCDFSINGICLKWNNKAFRVSRYDARYACQRARYQYGYIRNCRVSCR